MAINPEDFICPQCRELMREDHEEHPAQQRIIIHVLECPRCRHTRTVKEVRNV